MRKELGIFIICRKEAREGLSIVLPLPTSHHCMLLSYLDLVLRQLHAPFSHKDFHSFSNATPMPGTPSPILHIIQTLGVSILQFSARSWSVSADSGSPAKGEGPKAWAQTKTKTKPEHLHQFYSPVAQALTWDSRVCLISVQTSPPPPPNPSEKLFSYNPSIILINPFKQ